MDMDLKWIEEEYEARDRLSKKKKIRFDAISLINQYDSESTLIIFDLDDTLITTDFYHNNKVVVIYGYPMYILENAKRVTKVLCTSRKYEKDSLDLLIKQLKKADIHKYFSNENIIEDSKNETCMTEGIIMSGDLKKHQMVKKYIKKYDKSFKNIVFIDDSIRNVYGMMNNFDNIMSLHFDEDDEELYIYK